MATYIIRMATQEDNVNDSAVVVDTGTSTATGPSPPPLDDTTDNNNNDNNNNNNNNDEEQITATKMLTGSDVAAISIWVLTIVFLSLQYNVKVTFPIAASVAAFNLLMDVIFFVAFLLMTITGWVCLWVCPQMAEYLSAVSINVSLAIGVGVSWVLSVPLVDITNNDKHSNVVPKQHFPVAAATSSDPPPPIPPAPRQAQSIGSTGSVGSLEDYFGTPAPATESLLDFNHQPSAPAPSHHHQQQQQQQQQQHHHHHRQTQSIVMDAVSDTSSVDDIEDTNEAGGGRITVGERDNNDNDDDTDDDGEDEEEDDQDNQEGEEEVEEDLSIPPPEVDTEYTFPQDFDVHRSWRDVLRRARGGQLYFRLIIDPSCTEIPKGFFYKCFLLIEIVFAENSCLTEIGRGGFANCENLQRMNAFPVGLLHLRPMAFYQCESLRGKLVVPGTVGRVDYQCFQGCVAVTRVVFHDNPRPTANPVELQWFVFAQCRDLQSVRLPHNIVSIPRSAFLDCTALRKIPLPLSVEEIGREAFFYCSSLPSVDLPERTSRIGARAYKNCTSLAQVTIRTTEVLHCGRAVFWQCPALVTIQVYPSLWTTLFESMNNDPSFLYRFVRKYQSWKWTA